MTRAADEATELRDGAHALGVPLDARRADLLLDYLDYLYRWNDSAGLTSVPREQAVRLHLLDSLSVAPFVSAAGTLVDVGSGGGLPGIPLAVAVADLSVLLVESRRRKCSFLADAIRGLGVGRCEVAEEDARVLAAAGRRFGAVVARAFAPPVEFVSLASELVAPGGRIVVMAARGSEDLESLAASAVAPLRCVARPHFTLPAGSEERRLVVLEMPDST